MKQVIDFSKRGPTKKIEFQEVQQIHILCNDAIDELKRIQVDLIRFTIF